MRRIAALTAALLLAAPSAYGQNFYEYWGDGRAELSSYKVVQPRYGQLRQGYGVMVFVTEDIDRNTLIKVETPATPKADRVYALKLNNILKFTTGIYDYSVMTSVFSAVEPRAQPLPFELQKITLTAQEWCGHVFEEVVVRDGQLRGDLNSYFEAEGRQSWAFEMPQAFASEDHLLIRIREPKEPFMAEGESRAVTMLPALWQFRVGHRARELVPATLSKGTREPVDVGGRTYAAVPWTWSYGSRQQSVWVDTAYPHRILKWSGSDGASGELLATMRQPYWALHDLDDEHYRDELKIPR